MNSLIKLTEIFSKSSEYDPELRHVVQEHGLRELYVNPEHIVYIKEDQGYVEKFLRGEVTLELDKRTSFTRMAMNTSGQSTTQITVVGSPGQIVRKFSDFG